MPVGHNIQKHGGLKQNCPYCDQYETVYHVYQCDAENQRSHFVDKVERHLQEIFTRPSLKNKIMKELRDGLQTIPKTDDPTPEWYIYFVTDSSRVSFISFI